MALKSLLPISSFGHRSPPPANDARGELQQEFKQQVDRMMESMSHMPGRAMASGFDQREFADRIEVNTEVPGLAANEIEVTLSGSTLAIGSRHDEDHESDNASGHISERFETSFARRVQLPFEPEPSTITAKLENGMLRLVIPKAGAVPVKATRIPVIAA